MSDKSNNCIQTVERGNGFRLSRYERKAVFVLTENVWKLADVVGIERLGFLTLTTPDNCSYWTPAGWGEAQRRYHSFITNAYPGIFGDNSRRVTVLEPQRRGAVHWHLLAECPCDVRTGVNFDDFARGDYRTAPAGLRALWRGLRASCEAYGMGRHELLPIRKSREAIAEYVGKYIAKSFSRESMEMEAEGARRPLHARRVRYSAGPWRSARSSFAWASSGRVWREALAFASAQLGLKSLEDWTARYGPRWAYHLGDAILTAYELKKGVDSKPARNSIDGEGGSHATVALAVQA